MDWAETQGRARVPRRKSRTATATRLSRDRRLVALDTHAIRDQALRAYRTAEKKVAKLRQELDHYRDQDVPGFRGWLHRHFGAELTRQRELQQKGDAARALLREVLDLARRFGLSEIAAYRKLKWRRENPAAAEAEDRAQEERARRSRTKMDLEEDDDWADDLDAEWDAGWDEGPADAFVNDGDEPADGVVGSADCDSLKTVYRKIVRHLHPDQNAAFGAAEKQLWHEAQAAYRRGDLHALHKVLAHCGDGSGGIGRTSAVSFLQRVLASIRAQARALRGELREARQDMAWGFANKGPSAGCERRIRNELRQAEAFMADDVREMEAYIRELESAATARARTPRAASRARRY